MDYLFRRIYDPRLAPWQPTALGRTPPPNFDPNPLPEGKTLQPDKAPGYPRTANSAYWLASKAPPDLNDPPLLPEGKLLVSLPAGLFAYRRAAVHAYHIGLPVPPPELPPAGIRVVMAQPLNPRPFAAFSAYWQTCPVPGPEQPTPGKIRVSDPATLFVARRAPATAYAILPPPQPPDPNDPPPPPPGRPLFPATAPGAPRATADAYNGGGGAEDWFAFGAAEAGCPYRLPREGENITAPSRPASAPSLPQRSTPTITPPTRPRRCC